MTFMTYIFLWLIRNEHIIVLQNLTVIIMKGQLVVLALLESAVLAQLKYPDLYGNLGDLRCCIKLTSLREP